MDDGPSMMAARRPLRVLVAEDNRLNHAVIRHSLERLGHTVLVCGDGRAAVVAVEKEAYDLLLMDVEMPEANGLTATAAIRQLEAARPESHRIPIVALTAHSMTGDRERCLAAGMDDYLAKPVTTEALCLVLDRLFGPGSSSIGPDEQAAGDADGSLDAALRPLEIERVR